MNKQIYVFQKIPANLSIKLDFARGFAAFLVVLSHLRGGFFNSYDHLESNSKNIVNYILFFVSRLGHEAVIIFFVLSGYLVGGTLLSEYINGNPNWIRYFVNRISRMWTVLLPALILTAIFGYYTLHMNALTPGRENFTIKNFVGNVFFLQNIIVSPYGTDAPLWSLANEFWYYLLWPFILIIFKTNKLKLLKYFFALIFFIICIIIAPNIMILFPIWIIGAVIRLLKDNSLFRNRIFIIISYLLIILSLGISNIYSTIAGEYFLGFATCIVILGWQYGRILDISKIYGKIAHFFSEFSFSLYAVHYFFMFLLLELIKKYFGLSIRLNEASIIHWLEFILILLITYGWAFIFYWFTERYTFKIRQIIYNYINK